MKVNGNVLVFRNPKYKTSCIVLNILKTKNQRSGAYRKEIVTVVLRDRIKADYIGPCMTFQYIMVNTLFYRCTMCQT